MDFSIWAHALSNVNRILPSNVTADSRDSFHNLFTNEANEAFGDTLRNPTFVLPVFSSNEMHLQVYFIASMP